MNLIINILAMILAVISVIMILFVAAMGVLVAAMGGLVYGFLWIVGALAVLTVSVYQWWVRVLTGAKEVGRADTN